MTYAEAYIEAREDLYRICPPFINVTHDMIDRRAEEKLKKY